MNRIVKKIICTIAIIVGVSSINTYAHFNTHTSFKKLISKKEPLINQKKKPIKKKFTFVGLWGWEKDNDNTNFSLKIDKVGNNLAGTYCFVTDNAQKADCHDDDMNPSFTVSYPVGTAFTATFTPGISTSTGEVKIAFDGKFLIWTITKDPTGKFLAPKKARLIKGKVE